MPTSRFDDLMTRTFIPSFNRVFGIDALHTDRDGDETTVTIALDTQAVQIGEFGERMEPQTTVQIAASTGAVVGDTFTVAGTVTDDDPYPDDVIWTAAQLLSDDGYLRTFAVRGGS